MDNLEFFNILQSSYEAHPLRSQWERLARLVRDSRRLPPLEDYGSDTPEWLFKGLNALMLAAGRKIEGSQVAIIGCHTGLEVRIAKDLGAKAIGIERDREAVKVGLDLGIIDKKDVVINSAQRALARSREKFDAILANNLFLEGPEEFSRIYNTAYKRLKRGGVLILSGDAISASGVKQFSDFPIREEEEIVPTEKTFIAERK